MSQKCKDNSRIWLYQYTIIHTSEEEWKRKSNAEKALTSLYTFGFWYICGDIYLLIPFVNQQLKWKQYHKLGLESTWISISRAVGSSFKRTNHFSIKLNIECFLWVLRKKFWCIRINMKLMQFLFKYQISSNFRFHWIQGIFLKLYLLISVFFTLNRANILIDFNKNDYGYKKVISKIVSFA